MAPLVRWTAERFHAKVTLIHVIELPACRNWTMEGAYPVTYYLPAMVDDALTGLGSAWGDCHGDGAKKVVKQGDVSGNIVSYAATNNVDLIMMPTHGCGVFRRLLLGSTTAKVLHDANCAVWTAAHTTKNDVGNVNCRNIVCAVDLSSESVRLLQNAEALASELGASLLLVHAVSGAVPQSAFPGDDGFQRFLLDTAQLGMNDLRSRAGVTANAIVTAGNVSDTVRAAATDYKSDLVVIGRGRLHETLGGLRSNAYSIIRESPCPVLSFP